MKGSKGAVGLVLVALAATATALGVLLSPLLRPLDNQLYDAGLLARPVRAPDKVVVLGIEDDFMAGRHAYLAPRDRLARLINAAATGNPRGVVLDVWLDSRIDFDANGTDAQLRAALLSAKRQGVPVYLADIEGSGQNQLTGQTARGSVLPYFAEAAAGTGSVVFELDSDGAVRRLPPPDALPFLPAIMAGLQNKSIAVNAGAPLNFCGPPGAVQKLSAWQLAQQPMLAPLLQDKLVFIGATYRRSADFLDSPYSLRQGKERFYGVEVLAQATDSLLGPPFLQPENTGDARLTDALFCLILCLLAAVLARRSALLCGAFTALALVGCAWLAVASVQHPTWTLLTLTGPPRFHGAGLFFIALPLAAAASIAWRQTEQARELRLVRDTFGAYVGPEVLAELGGRLPELGGEVRPIAVLFCDIRGYSALAERMQHDPQALMNQLNAHFTPLVGALKDQGAYVDNYVGDLVMALFNAPVQRGTVELAAQKAVTAALDFVRLVDERNKARLAAGELPIEVGIGLHCGDAVVGNLGAMGASGGAAAGAKIHYTAIGDTVNIASRVESATRGYAVPLLVTEEIVEACGGGYAWVFVDETKVKGRTAPVRLYAPAHLPPPQVTADK